MKKVILSLLVFIFLSGSPLLAIDEDGYIQFAADSIITLHGLKGNPNAMELWAKEMKSMHPGFMNQDLSLFEGELINDKDRKERIYGRILDTIRRKGYNARLVDLGSGLTTIDIVGE
ncbi:MAG: hypothetical protein ISS34_01730 [Candidatus Omnitrophica bacterium]|nr:hypothetical protein [Candidatus Omnitrophota bacterium]